MRMLDLFCGRFGWGRAFAERGWEVVGVDLVEPQQVPAGCRFVEADVLDIWLSPMAGAYFLKGQGNTQCIAHGIDFICASSPCEQFSKHGLRCFYSDPPYPDAGIRLFNHARGLCEASGLPYVMENVRAAQQFVGNATQHCGPFYLWGNAVPPIMPQGILKGRRLKTSGYKAQTGATSDRDAAASVATIPPELANAVAAYAERLIESRVMA